MEDMAQALLWVAQRAPAALEGARSEEFMLFVIVFLGSPEYIKNTFLRAKLLDVRPLAASGPPAQGSHDSPRTLEP